MKTPLEIALVIAGMVAVTYIPRLLPFVLKGKRELPAWQRRALSLVPFAAIGALIIPDGVTAVHGDVTLSLIGLGAAALTSALVRQPFVVVVVSVLVVAAAQALL